MLDIKKIRKDPEFFKQKLATRGVKAEEIDAQKVEEERINAENALKSSTSTLEHKSAEMLLRKALNKKTIKDIYGK